MATTSAAHRALMQRVTSCRACPRLVEHRERAGAEKVRRYREWDYWARPVPTFGSPDAEVCMVGLAPAAHGGNRTGRMFTGDPSADFLAAALYAGGFASQPTSQHRDDGLTLINACITSAVKCAPPANQPTTEEQARCLPYLVEELRLMPNVKAVLGLGKLGFDAYLRAARAMGLPRPAASSLATASATPWVRVFRRYSAPITPVHTTRTRAASHMTALLPCWRKSSSSCGRDSYLRGFPP